MSAVTSAVVPNDHPYLTLENQTIDENAVTGTRITRLFAFDPEGDAVTYSLIHDAGGRFKFENGYLVVADGARLNYEDAHWYDILIRTSDDRGASYDSVVRIYLNDVASEPETPPAPQPTENHAPTIVRLVGGSVGEGSIPGWVVGFFQGVDPDGDTFSYELIDDAGGKFALARGKQLVVAGALDYEVQSEYTVTVRATDAHGLWTDSTFQVHVLDNDSDGHTSDAHAPRELVLHGGAIREDAGAATVVGSLTAIDPDGGTLTYTLVDNAEGRFAMNGSTIVLADGAQLDFETQPTHDVKVRVTDASGLLLEKIFTLHVLDVVEQPSNTPPTMVMLDGVSVLENSSAGVVVGQLRAHDPDGDALTFSLFDDAQGRFEIRNGLVVVSEGANLDFETAQTHVIGVRVDDGHGGVREAAFTIHVRDVVEHPPGNNAPVIVELAGNHVPEATSNGWTVGAIIARDADGDPLTFTLLDSADGRFAMVGDRIVVADASRIDFETGPSHQVRVRVVDTHGLSAERTFTIQVDDLPDSPPKNHAPEIVELAGNHVPEVTSNGSVVGVVIAHDPDGDPMVFALKDSADGRFAIVGNKIVVADASRIDFEVAQSHDVRVSVTDPQGHTSERTFTIQVDDLPDTPPPPSGNHAPIDLVLSDQSVAENSDNGTVVSLILGRDPDANDTLTYKLLDSAGGRFAIVGDELVVADGTKLDHEAAGAHQVTIRVTDASGASLDRAFSIVVEDIEDEDANGGDANDTIIGGGGDDAIFGRGGDDFLTGGLGHDSISGGAGNDRLFGGGGNDVLTGGLGRDTMTGGAGRDSFVFDTANGNRNIDQITDFSVRDDTIHLAKAVFGAAGRKGMLAKDAFWIGAAAHDSDDRIIYDQQSGKVFYDADGTGTKAAVQFATIRKGLSTLSEKDFLII